MEVTKNKNKEIYEPLPDIPLSRIIHTIPKHNDNAQSDLLSRLSLKPFRLNLDSGGTRYACLLSASISPRNIVSMAYGIPFPYDRVDDPASLLGPEFTELLKTRAYEYQLEDRVVDNLKDNRDQIREIVLDRSFSQKRDSLRIKISTDTLLLGKPGQHNKFSLILFNRAVCNFDMNKFTTEKNERNIKEGSYFLPFSLLNSTKYDGPVMFYQTTADIIPALIFDVENNHILMHSSNQSFFVNYQAKQITKQALVDPVYQLKPQDLHFDHPSAHLLSGAIALGYLDQRFNQAAVKSQLNQMNFNKIPIFHNLFRKLQKM